MFAELVHSCYVKSGKYFYQAQITFVVCRDTSKVNFYDARRRLWYNEAINSPKDVIIILDLSGSLIETPFTIAKLAIKMLINTFQQNDFFNVFYSHDQKVSLVEPCLQKLMQATYRNKEMIKEKVDQMPEPYGEANNTGLFREAFEMFNQSLDEDTSTSGCTKALMFISDGTEKTNEFDSIIQSYKKYIDVVVFTYFVGFGPCKDMMSELAVQNGGAMYEFPTLGSP